MKLEDAARALGPPGRLSRIEKDAMLARIEARRVGWYRRPRARAFTAMVTAGIAVAIALVVLVPRPRRHELTPRGASDDLTLVLRCGDREPGDCRIGDRVVFDLGSAPPAGYIALFARDASGKVIWYLPAGEGVASHALESHATTGIVDSVAVIDDSYAPGRYELFAIVSPQPLTRADIRAFADGDRLVAPPGIRIETRAFVIREEAPR